MTQYSKASLKTFFETNDIPTGTNYADFIDSYVNLVETVQQSMAGPIYTTELITPKVSASLVYGTEMVTPKVSATNINCTGTVSADTIGVDTAAIYDNYSTNTHTNNLKFSTVSIVSAAGTTQATAALISATIILGQGATDGSATGFLLTSPSVGKIQYLIHEGAVSANLWPSSGCKINSLADNAAYSLAANTMYTIIHSTTSAYAVK